MGKRATTTLLITIGAAFVLATGSSIASALPSASAPASAGAAKAAITIAMRDPGCHWFVVNGQYKAKLAVSGATQFVNQDEAAVVVKAKGFARRVPVGKTITVSKPGIYHITMVGQASDDNHLVLKVK